eukprot:m.23732 g.23732  ORF g.23732 m.23732 type:complete len:250 (+) comp3933_c0_seq1:105-854(+)
MIRVCDANGAYWRDSFGKSIHRNLSEMERMASQPAPKLLEEARQGVAAALEEALAGPPRDSVLIPALWHVMVLNRAFKEKRIPAGSMLAIECNVLTMDVMSHAPNEESSALMFARNALGAMQDFPRKKTTPELPALQSFYRRIADAMYRTGHLHEASEALAQCLELWRMGGGVPTADTLRLYIIHAEILAGHGDKKKALKYYDLAYSLLRTGSPSPLPPRTTLAIVRGRLRKHLESMGKAEEFAAYASD